MSTMRVPANTPLVNIPQDRSGGRRYGLDLGMVPQREAGSLAAFGGAAAAGYGAMSRGLDDTGRLLVGVSVDLQRREDETRALEAYNQLNERVGLFLNGDGSPESGLFNRKGAMVVGSVKDTREFFDKTVTELAAGLSPNAAKEFSARADVLRFGEQRKVTMFESDGRRKWEFNTLKASAELEQRAYLDNVTDPRLREESLARGIENVQRLAQLSGKPPEEIQLITQKYRAAAVMAGADALIKQGRFGDAMAMSSDESLLDKESREIQSKAAEGNINFWLEGGSYTDMVRLNEQAAGYTREGLTAFEDCLGPKIKDVLLAECAAQGVSPEIALSVMKCESDGDPNAKSGAGAIGLMQLMPGTAKDLGVDPHDPPQNIKGGVKYLKQLLDKYGADRLDLVFAAYNAGPGNVDKAGGVPNFAETQTYVARNMGLLGLLEPGAGPVEGAPVKTTDFGKLSPDAQVQASLALLTPEKRRQVQNVVRGRAAESFAASLEENISAGRMTDAEALQQISTIADPELKQKTRSEWNMQSGIRKSMEKEQRKEAEGAVIDKFVGLGLPEQYQLWKSLPEGTAEARTFKNTLKGIYDAKLKEFKEDNPKYKNMRAGSDPAAYGNILDKITYVEITDLRSLYTDPDAAKLRQGDLQYFTEILQKSQQLDLAIAQKSFARVLGEVNGQPGKDKLSTDEDKARFAAFAPFAQAITAKVNRAQDAEFIQDLAKSWLRDGEYNHSGVAHFGYGDDGTLEDVWSDTGQVGDWLPKIEHQDKMDFAAQPEDVRQKYLKQFSADDPKDQEEWAARGWSRDQKFGPIQRPAALRAKDIIPEDELKEIRAMFDNNQDLVYAFQDAHPDNKSSDAMYLWAYSRKRRLEQQK